LTRVTGVDGCRIGWVAATQSLNSNDCSVDVFPTFAKLLESSAASKVIAVDIPIGLGESSPRPTDLAVRSLLGPRSSSVFPAPCRASLNGASYESASALSFAASGKKLTKQTYAIIPKIREVDVALQNDTSARARVVEVHPEVCFAVLNDDQPMEHPKKRSAGKVERIAVLPAKYQAAFATARPRWLRKEVATDDILDALVALWTAVRVHSGSARSFPPLPLEYDSVGLPMRILA
jgi:predicted RNase H-like nuclease